MRTTIALAATLVSCGSPQVTRSTVPRPIHNGKCSDSEVHESPQTAVATTSDHGWAVPLRLCAFRDGFGLCNPSGEPPGMTGFWQVSAAEVANIDRALLSFLRQQKASRPDLEQYGLEQYGRQYLGFLRDTRRYVLVNAIPPLPRFTAERAQAELIGVCDATWGVEYDVATQQFTQLGLPGPG
jgi:hypothetical protein